MKQTIKNFGKALLGLVMTEKHQPLSDGWIKQNDKEIKKSVKNSSFRPRWMSKLNTTVKNEFKSGNDFANLSSDIDRVISTKQFATKQKLKDALEKLGSQPGYGKFEKSDKEYIKCDGTGQTWHRDEIYYYPLSNLHLSKDFFRKVTIEQLERDFDINNDNDFRAWFLYHLLKMREE